MDAITKLRLKAQERERQAAYDEAVQVGISNYALAVDRVKKLTETIKYHVPRESQALILTELRETMEAINVCIVPQFISEYENRTASKNVDIVGGGVM